MQNYLELSLLPLLNRSMDRINVPVSQSFPDHACPKVYFHMSIRKEMKKPGPVLKIKPQPGSYDYHLL